MFDISFGELLLICVVALVVLGPERLPAVARTLGALVARAQRFVASVKADIGQQTDLAGLQALKNEVRDTAYALRNQLGAELEQAQSVVQDARSEVAALSGAAIAPEPEVAAEAAEPAASAAPLPANTAAADVDAVPVETVAVPAPAASAAQALPSLATASVDENQLDLFAEPPPAASSRETQR